LSKTPIWNLRQKLLAKSPKIGILGINFLVFMKYSVIRQNLGFQSMYFIVVLDRKFHANT